MVGFARFATPYSVGLKKAPAWRENVQSADPLQTFASDSAIRYAQRADLIRDMRFNRSNEFNADSALRNKRERMISEYIDKNRDDPDALAGVYDRFKAKYSRSDGALSNPMVPPSVSEVSRSAPQPLQATRPSGSGVPKVSQRSASTDAMSGTSAPTFRQRKQPRHTHPSPPMLVIPQRNPVDALNNNGGGAGAGRKKTSTAMIPYASLESSDEDEDVFGFSVEQGVMTDDEKFAEFLEALEDDTPQKRNRDKYGSGAGARADPPPGERRRNTDTPAPPRKDPKKRSDSSKKRSQQRNAYKKTWAEFHNDPTNPLYMNVNGLTGD